MNININKNLMFAVVLLIAVGATIFVGGKVFVDKVAEKVIDKLQRDYTPGPYQPGFDPDKVDSNFFNKNQPKKQQPKYGRSEIDPQSFNRIWDDYR